MPYNSEIYQKAIKILEKKRLKNLKNTDQRKNLFFLKNKRALEIEKALARTSILTAKAILNGKNCKEQLEFLKNKNISLQNELHDILKKNNLPSNYLEINYDCKKCSDTGYIDGKMCDCLKQLLKVESYNKLNSISPLSLSSFDTFSLDYYSNKNYENTLSPRNKMEKILNFCVNYSKNFSLNSHNIFMTGKTGLGKTHLSLAIANELINKNFGVIYASLPNIISKLEREKFKRDGSFENTESHLLNCDLLILDDLGTEFQTSFSNSIIYNIINSRILYKKPTIISTNYSSAKGFKELEKIYSERLVSRILGNFKILQFAGEDIRSILGLKKFSFNKQKN